MQKICLHRGKIYTGVASIENGSVIINDGIIEDVVSEHRLKSKLLPHDTLFVELNGRSVAPGFIDTHIHGFEGFDTANGTVEDFLGISKGLPQIGVTSFCPTLYPQESHEMLQTIKAGRHSMGREVGARINGLHLEGPFLSCQKLGVQRPETIKPVDLNFMKEMYKAASGAISIMTVAPELTNMRDLALYCSSKDIILSAGHTNASYENMMEGIQAGILHCTHVFNAMRQLHHRDPGCVGAILIHSDLSCEVIADGFHVHPALIKLLLRNKPDSKIILVTDALGPTGKKGIGPFYANQEEVFLSEDGVWRRVKDQVIAGSALTLDRAVFNMSQWGASKEGALRMAASNAALLLHKEKETGYLLPDKLADVIIFDDQTMQIHATYVQGILKYQRE
jgi:N-acetylglucosamine-6-phosphate deacetylase